MATQHFKTNVLLKSIIGKDLINNDNIAVLELVKNSFDAGSKKVTVEFNNLLSNDDSVNPGYSRDSSRIVVQDSGCGMSHDAIVQKWLNIAYSDKKQNKTAHGRVMAGAKGIGRFSCDRLGVFLDLYTREVGKQIVHLQVDWRKFEVEGNPDKQIESVDVDVRYVTDQVFSGTSGFSRLDHGTILVISKLRSAWDEERLISLRRYLERLINPNQAFSKTAFSLHLKASEFGATVNGKIENRIFGRLDFTSTSIESAISEDGMTITTVLRDKGRDIFELVERNQRLGLLKNIRTAIYYLNPYAKGYFKRLTGLDKVKFGSVFLFINGFRIPPYGDENDDWLGLDRHKLQGTARFLGTREVIGRIEVDDPNGSYKIVSSREGIVQDSQFSQMIERPDGFYYRAHRRLERYVVEGLDWDRVARHHAEDMLDRLIDKQWKFDPGKEIYSESEQAKNFRILESLDTVIGAKRDDIISLTINAKLLGELAKLERDKAEEILSNFENITPDLGKSTGDAMERLRRAFSQQARREEQALAREADLAKKLTKSESEKAQIAKENFFLRNATSSDTKGIVGLQHQIGVSADSIRRKLSELARAITEGSRSEILLSYVRGISLENRKIQAVARYATKASFSMVDKSTHGPKDLVHFITQYAENVFLESPEHKLAGRKIEVRVSKGKNLKFETKFSPLDIVIVVDNLLDNARKARATAIDLAFELNGSGLLEMRHRDNGDGVDPRCADRIFDFGFTTTDGSGIGLAHAKQIMERLGGIRYVAPQGRGAEFIVTFKK